MSNRRLSLRDRVHKLKSRLPWNGDWIWVTEEARDSEDDSEQPRDLLANWETAGGNRLRLGCVAPEVSGLLLSEAKERYSDSMAALEKQREKAAKILANISIILTILLAGSSLMLGSSSAVDGKGWLWVQGGMLVWAVAHFLRSFVVSISILSRIAHIEPSPGELATALSRSEREPLTWSGEKELAAIYIACKAKNEGIKSENAWQMTISLYSFQWAIIWATLFVFVHLGHQLGLLPTWAQLVSIVHNLYEWIVVTLSS